MKHAVQHTLTPLVLCLVATPALAEPLAAQGPELARARAGLIVLGILVMFIGVLALIRLYSWRLKRRLRQPMQPSRMSPNQWQARRWRDAWLRRVPPRSTDDRAP